MLLNMREKDSNNLVSRDILDIDMSLSVIPYPSQDPAYNGKFCVSVNKKYIDDGFFDTRGEAEERLKQISSARNELESKLLSYE